MGRRKNSFGLEAVAGGGLLIAAMFFGGGLDQITEFQSAHTEARISRQKDNDLQVSKTIAEQRYTDGCALIVLRENDKPVGIAENQPVVDRLTGAPLPDNTVVCDLLGNTARISGGKGYPTDIHFTGDAELVSQAAQRQGLVLSGGAHHD